MLPLDDELQILLSSQVVTTVEYMRGMNKDESLIEDKVQEILEDGLENLDEDVETEKLLEILEDQSLDENERNLVARVIEEHF